MINEIGDKLKILRTKRELTLKELGHKTNLSIGFLSQIERGVTSVAISSLDSIAKALDTDLSYFFIKHKEIERKVLRSYEHEVFKIKEEQLIDYHLTINSETMDMLPKMQVILPNSENLINDSSGRNGEEFIHVIEGILNVTLEQEMYRLYPGDIMHYNSKIPHSWNNSTNKNTKVLVINTFK